MEVRSLITGNRGVCLPFSDYCEPIASVETPFEKLLDFAAKYGRGRGWQYVEIRGGEAFLGEENAAISYFDHKLDLHGDPEEIFSRFAESTRRNVRKAQKEGVQVAIGDSFDSVKAFYRLNCITRRRHGLPPQPFKFFSNLHRYVISRGLGFVTSGSYRGTNIASAIFLHFGERALYKFGASSLEHQNLRANNLVIWEAIQWYLKQGYATLSFGRTEVCNAGLRRFKKGWGVDERQMNYYRYELSRGVFVGRQPRPVLDGRYAKVIRRVPVPLLRMVGPALYGHFG
jgi:hypothetical protein